MTTPLRGRLAVVTGAGSGIGRALALACAQRGMRVLIADLHAEGLRQTAQLIGRDDTLQRPTDVSDADAVLALADLAYREAGDVALLFNNAGVATGGWLWESTPQDWQWLLGVNLMGVVHGIQAFVPRMLQQAQPAHVVNTASAAGLISVPGASAYCATKHAVLALSECLEQELRAKGAPLGVSVLCPSFVRTGIADSEQHRPAELARPGQPFMPRDPNLERGMQTARLSADDIAAFVLDGVMNASFYLLPHSAIRDGVAARMQAIVQGAAPAGGRLPAA